jgi:hypothetical protein
MLVCSYRLLFLFCVLNLLLIIIQRVSEISTLILTTDSSSQEQQNFYVSFFRNIIFISVLPISITHIYLHISGVILQNLDWLQLKFDFVSGTARIFIRFEISANFK